MGRIAVVLVLFSIFALRPSYALMEKASKGAIDLDNLSKDTISGMEADIKREKEAIRKEKEGIITESNKEAPRPERKRRPYYAEEEKTGKTEYRYIKLSTEEKAEPPHMALMEKKPLSVALALLLIAILAFFLQKYIKKT